MQSRVFTAWNFAALARFRSWLWICVHNPRR